MRPHTEAEPPAASLQAPVTVAGVAIHPLNLHQAVEHIASMAGSGQGGLIVTPNVDHVLLVRSNDRFRQAYERAELRLCDGGPLMVLARLCGRHIPERVTGADLMVPVSGRCAELGLKVMVVGGAPATLEACLANLRGRFPTLAIEGISPTIGFEGTPADLELQQAIERSAPNMVFVCIGTPRGEIWAADQLRRWPAAYISAGAAVDFVAGTKSRAPAWMQRLSLEWLYRLWREPRRLAYRYLVRDPQFLPLAVREVFRARRDRRRVR